MVVSSWIHIAYNSQTFAWQIHSFALLFPVTNALLHLYMFHRSLSRIFLVLRQKIDSFFRYNLQNSDIIFCFLEQNNTAAGLAAAKLLFY